MNKKAVIGIDGGGTYTRVVITDLEGNILSTALQSGSHPEKNRNAKENVRGAIKEAILKADIKEKDIRMVVGGFAGLNSKEDLVWAEEFTDIEELRCTRMHINDAVIAQEGAFLGDSGIIAICGTGSIVLGRDERGGLIRNYDFQHNARAGSRYFSYDALFDLMIRESEDSENEFMQEILRFWEAEDIEDLSKVLYHKLAHINIDVIQKLSEMAPIVINYAEKGNEGCRKVCDNIAKSLSVGINLVASQFSEDIVSVAFTGGVFKSNYIRQLMKDNLTVDNYYKQFSIIEPKVSPCIGAVLIAYKELGISLEETLLSNLIKSDEKLSLYRK